MRTFALAAACVALCIAPAFAQSTSQDPPAAQPSPAAKARALDLYLSQNLVRAGNVRYSNSKDAIAALKRNDIASVRVLVCPLTHRENVDKLVDALVAAEIYVSQAKVVESREYRCADNARVETRTGT
jgi:hypothetical protein